MSSSPSASRTTASALLPQYPRAVLALANGSIFHGYAIGAPGSSVGEVVFNTALTGYQEILSDPSYARQIVTLTYPHIGNVGVNPDDEESAGAAAAGLIVRELPGPPSNWRSKQTLEAYLRVHGLPAIAAIDTRKLTRILRNEGAQAGCLLALDHGARVPPEELAKQALEQARSFPGMSGLDLAREVSTPWPYCFDRGSWRLGVEQSPFLPEAASGFPELAAEDGSGSLRVVAVDLGIKRNILRMMVDRGCSVLVVPAQTSPAQVLDHQPDGVFLSNGPGDPEPCCYAIDLARQVMARRIPLFGICLGHQILGLASGARTLKMKFGHHGANHPVKDLQTGAVLISSQNHGFAIDPESLPSELVVTHRSLFDGSIQGVARKDCPAFGFQGHPEASPGPHDLAPLFDRFIAAMREGRAGKARESQERQESAPLRSSSEPRTSLQERK